jgi:serine/threonine-protein kinase
LVGTTIGNYRVTRQLGEGGMGVVYEAEHPVIGRKVAIKLLHLALARDPEVVARFFNEARAIHTVGHENIVEIMDFGQTADGQPYFIMEFLAGEAMNDRIARNVLTPVEACEVADQICRALGAAHDKGIVHRDLKPHNVQLLPTTSGRMHLKLLDFGVAKIMNAADLSQSVKTRTGSLMGTPIYMSPEQCKGSAELDSRTDIYSLGVMLYEMLAGRPPFVAAGVGELFAMHMLQPAPPVTDFAPKTPPMMAAAVMKALAKDPRDRFATMEELRQAFLGDNLPMPTYRAPGRTQNYRSQPASTLPMPAAHASTTLSASPREVVAEGPAGDKKKSRGGLVLGAVLLAGGVATYLFMVPKGTKNAEPPPASATEPAAAAPAPAASKMVTVRFESDPPGAHVARVTDEKDLGAVPFELKLPRAGGKPEYRFHLDGYQDQTLTADLASDLTLKASLEKTAAPPPSAPAAAPPPPAAPAAHAETPHHPASTPHHPARPAHPSADDDGLATPKF